MHQRRITNFRNEGSICLSSTYCHPSPLNKVTRLTQNCGSHCGADRNGLSITEVGVNAETKRSRIVCAWRYSCSALCQSLFCTQAALFHVQ